jgi:hypothetical protein
MWSSIPVLNNRQVLEMNCQIWNVQLFKLIRFLLIEASASELFSKMAKYDD